MPRRAVLFDLDGTLIDTSIEIGLALERTFGDLGLAPPSPQVVRELIGRGVMSMVERALLKAEATGFDVASVSAVFERHYADTVATAAPLYPGVEAAFALLRNHGVPIGVVTNKPRYFTERLLDRFSLGNQLGVVVTGDDGLAKKPAPDMVLAGCDRLGTVPAQTWMIGDSNNDVLAARGAGCRVWCVPYGYNEGRPLESLACDRLVRSVLEAAQGIVAAAVET